MAKANGEGHLAPAPIDGPIVQYKLIVKPCAPLVAANVWRAGPTNMKPGISLRLPVTSLSSERPYLHHPIMTPGPASGQVELFRAARCGVRLVKGLWIEDDAQFAQQFVQN